MKQFWIRMLTVAAITVMLLGYNGITGDHVAADEQAKAEADAVAAEASGSYLDGTYQGTATGYSGDVTVEVTIENGMISNLAIVSADGEDASYLSMAENILPEILEAQSADVDTVSGATFSSNGIKSAVASALEDASQQ